MIHHFVLADDASSETLLEALDPVLARIDDEVGVSFGDPEIEETDGVTIRSFADFSDLGHALTVVDDPQLGRHIELEGDRADAIGRILAEALPVERSEDLISRASDTRAPRDVLRVALSQPAEPTTEAVGVIVSALRSSDSDTVAAGITAAAMTDPAQFAGDLRRLAAASPDQGLRLMAEQSLAGGGHS